MKLSALPCHSTQPYPFPNLHPSIKAAVEAFGADRLYWGSDLTRLPCPYREAVTLFSDELGFLSEAERAAIMGTALARFLDWNSPQ